MSVNAGCGNGEEKVGGAWTRVGEKGEKGKEIERNSSARPIPHCVRHLRRTLVVFQDISRGSLCLVHSHPSLVPPKGKLKSV